MVRYCQLRPDRQVVGHARRLELAATLNQFDGPMHWLAVSPDGRTLADPGGRKDSDTGQMSIVLWDVADADAETN